MKTFNKGIYWHDFAGEEDMKLDSKMQVIHPCEAEGIFIKRLIFAEFPQVLNEEFDILFFDWGGMSIGNDLIYHFCKNILNVAKDKPSRYYVMVSSFTEDAMKEAVREFGKEKPFNVFLSVKELAIFLKGEK